jgi:CDP-6-deoxy-D-xylo-4-hexulose-3-dehydrase
LLDFKRVPLYTSHRKFCGEIFTSLLDQNSFYNVQVKNEDNLFSLPIIAKNKETIDKIKKFCVNEGIEYRPIIGGNLLKQTAFKKYAKTGDYPNADILNQNGIYVGLHYGVTAEQINKFVNTINKI